MATRTKGKRLSAHDIATIRRQRSAGAKVVDIARSYSVHCNVVSNMTRQPGDSKRTHNHVQDQAADLPLPSDDLNKLTRRAGLQARAVEQVQLQRANSALRGRRR